VSRAGTRIERVRLHGDALDAAQARLQLGGLLAGAEVRPSGLAPSALLCVRRVRDPLPGVLRLNTRDARPPPEWERALVATLEKALCGAARPAREAVPAGAEAVLFADRAELLACLARAARDGTVWASWWWQEVRTAAGIGSDPVVSAWLETPEHVPAALELLAARGEAPAFVAGLSPADAIALVERVATAFAVPELLPGTVWAMPAATAGRGADVARAVPLPAATAGRGADAAGAVPPPAPPWRDVVPEAAQLPLSPPAELLLGVALTLRRSPGVARSQPFAAAARRWFAPVHDPRPSGEPLHTARVARSDAEPEQRIESSPARDEPQQVPSGDVTEPPMQAPATAVMADRADEARPAHGRTDRPPPAHEPSVVPPMAAETSPHARTTDAAGYAVHPAAPSDSPASIPRRARPATPAVPPARPPHENAPDRPRAVTPSTRPPTASEPTDSVPALVVDTGLGGVFYLLNLALFLDLYGDFTRPLEPGLSLSPWDLLALLAPKLLTEPSRDDPLWPLLARLAGRKRRERPGAGFRPPRLWRTPKSWLEPFDHDGPWRWSAARDTLRLVHPAGFPVVSVPRRKEPARRQLSRELRRLRPLEPELRRATLAREPVRPLARWTARLAAYADARLRRALDLEPGDALDVVLLRHHARIFVSPTHVDVFLRLADLPLEIRFAGLDRTPGWIPAAGRYVALHFE
jgi:hypothetical protein